MEYKQKYLEIILDENIYFLDFSACSVNFQSVFFIIRNMLLDEDIKIELNSDEKNSFLEDFRNFLLDDKAIFRIIETSKHEIIHSSNICEFPGKFNNFSE